MEHNTEENQEAREGRMRYDGSSGKTASDWVVRHFSGPERRLGLEAREAIIRAAFEGCILPVYASSSKRHQLSSELPGSEPTTPLSKTEGEVMDCLVLYNLLLPIPPIHYTPREFSLQGPRTYILVSTMSNSHTGGFWY